MSKRTPRDGTSARAKLLNKLAPYRRPSVSRSVRQILNSLVPYVGLWWGAYFLLDVSFWAAFPAMVLAAGFLIRVFIISHDCGHGSFFSSRRANDIVGAITSFLVFVPYYRWKREHAIHHASSGDLDSRGVGDIETLTVKEYMALPRFQRIKYRLYRHPLVMFIVGPMFIFLIYYRFFPKNATRRERLSVVRTNVLLVLVMAAMWATIGIEAYVLVQGPIIALATIVGVWLFYVQHQFEDVYWERKERWDFVAQALEGSSYYKLPRILQWFSGNIGFHHIHHLNARIPNYNLERCQKEVPDLQRVPPLTLLGSFRSLAFRLWDEDRRRLVGFDRVRELRRSNAATPAG